MNPPKIEAVAFDMDGTMFNTEDLYDGLGEILLRRRNQSFTRELKLEMMGLPGPVAFEIMRQRCNLEESVKQLQDECDEIFVGMLPARIEMMPGLEQLMSKLEKLQIPKCVATSSHRQFAEKSLGHFDQVPRLEFILTADDVPNGKPHPDIYLAAAKKLGVEPENMLALEDSFTGSEAAAASGAYTIAVPTIHSREMDFSHVDKIAESLADEKITELFR